MNFLQSIGAIAAMICTAGCTLTMWVFSAASLANVSDQSAYQRVMSWVVVLSVFSIVGIVSGIALLLRKRFATAATVAVVPSAIMFVALVWQIVRPS